MYLQDKYQIQPNLSLTLGLRYDWNGGLTEKDGRITNFDPSLYQFDEGEPDRLSPTDSWWPATTSSFRPRA